MFASATPIQACLSTACGGLIWVCHAVSSVAFAWSCQVVHMRAKEQRFFSRNFQTLAKLSTYLCAASFGLFVA